MRKFSIAVLAVAALVAVASVAYAANVYKVHLGSTTAKGKGSKANPIPTGLKFGFQVEETDSSKRAIRDRAVRDRFRGSRDGSQAVPEVRVQRPR